MTKMHIFFLFRLFAQVHTSFSSSGVNDVLETVREEEENSTITDGNNSHEKEEETACHFKV